MKSLTFGLLTIIIFSLIACQQTEELKPDNPQSKIRISKRSSRSTVPSWNEDNDDITNFKYNSEGLLTKVAWLKKWFDITYDNQNRPINIKSYYNNYLDSDKNITWLNDGFDVTESHYYQDKKAYKLDDKGRVEKEYTIANDTTYVRNHEYSNGDSKLTISRVDYQTGETMSNYSYQFGSTLNPFKDINIAILEVIDFLTIEPECEQVFNTTYAVENFEDWDGETISVIHETNDQNYPIRTETVWSENNSEYFFYEYEEWQ